MKVVNFNKEPQAVRVVLDNGNIIKIDLSEGINITLFQLDDDKTILNVSYDGEEDLSVEFPNDNFNETSNVKVIQTNNVIVKQVLNTPLDRV